MLVLKIVAYYMLILIYVMLIGYVFRVQDYDGGLLMWITYGFIGSSFPYLAINICGLFFGHPFYNDESVGDLNRWIGPKRVIFRIVTRGKTPQLVQRTIDSALRVLQPLSSGTYHIEVVTDASNNLTPNPNVTEIVVPPSFECTTKYKGRALQYALYESDAHDKDWLVHLDEETSFDVHTLKYILQYICNEDENRGKKFPRIGQGVITYGHQRPISLCHTITTLADSIRVTDDFGRFRLQFVFGTSLFGMKGSYIIIRNDLEKFISFDHGPKSSVTEDAFFALYARSRHIGFRFVKGFMYERSPFTLMDFVKQRKRWFIGLTATITAGKIPIWYRKELILCMIIWVLQPLAYIWIVINFCRTYDYLNPEWAPFAQLILNPFTFIYQLGFMLSLNRSEYKIHEYAILCVLQTILIPLFSVMEFAGILYAFATWDMGFFIVQKDIQPPTGDKLFPIELEGTEVIEFDTHIPLPPHKFWRL